jgi:hypothetical protein
MTMAGCYADLNVAIPSVILACGTVKSSSVCVREEHRRVRKLPPGLRSPDTSRVDAKRCRVSNNGRVDLEAITRCGVHF